MRDAGEQGVIRGFLLGAMLLAASAQMGCEGGAAGGLGPIEPTPLTSADFSSVRFQAVLCQVRLPPERVVEIDPDRLAAGGVKGFVAKLSAIGTSRVLYRLDQTVDLHTTSRIRTGSRVPFVTNARMTQTGRTVRAIEYVRAGVNCRITPKPVKDTDPPCMQAKVEIDLTTAADSRVSVSEKVKAVAMHSVTLLHAGPVALGRPFVMVATGPAGQGKDAEAVAFVCRAVFTRRNIVRRPAAPTQPASNGRE